jgi:hypothetical protein
VGVNPTPGAIYFRIYMSERHPLVDKMIKICEEVDANKIVKAASEANIKQLEWERDRLKILKEEIQEKIDKANLNASEQYKKVISNIKELSSYLPKPVIVDIMKNIGLSDKDISDIFSKI